MLTWATPATWFAAACADRTALLSDHMHCERKAAENALGLVRRYPALHGHAVTLTRLAHEETAHMVQVAALIEARGLRVRSDTPNRYARALFAAVRQNEPGRLVDTLLASAFIEARSHERLGLLAAGFAGDGDAELASFYAALAGAEERHAGIFIDLARPLIPAAALDERITAYAALEAGVIAGLPAVPRIH